MTDLTRLRGLVDTAVGKKKIRELQELETRVAKAGEYAKEILGADAAECLTWFVPTGWTAPRTELTGCAWMLYEHHGVLRRLTVHTCDGAAANVVALVDLDPYLRPLTGACTECGGE